MIMLLGQRTSWRSDQKSYRASAHCAIPLLAQGITNLTVEFEIHRSLNGMYAGMSNCAVRDMGTKEGKGKREELWKSTINGSSNIL